MTRLKRYLDMTRDEALAMVKKDCKTFFKYTDKPGAKYPLYRGYTGTFIRTIKKIEPRTDRRPSDMPLDYHKYLDELFKKKFGWKVRSEGVFVTADKDMARHYGTSYWFFPIGDFKYVWSDEVGDLYDEIEVLPGLSDVQKDFLGRLILTYRDTDLEEGIWSSHEIAIKCNSYYLVNPVFIGVEYYEIFK